MVLLRARTRNRLAHLLAVLALLSCGRSSISTDRDAGRATDAGGLGPSCDLSSDWEPTAGFEPTCPKAPCASDEWIYHFASHPLLVGGVEYRVKADYRHERQGGTVENLGDFGWFISACNRGSTPMFTRGPSWSELAVVPGPWRPGFESFDDVIESLLALTPILRDSSGQMVPLYSIFPFDAVFPVDPSRPYYVVAFQLDPGRDVAIRMDGILTAFPRRKPIFFDFRNDYNARVGKPPVESFDYRSEVTWVFQLPRFEPELERVPIHDGNTVACNVAGFPVSECCAIGPRNDRAVEDIPTLTVKTPLPEPLLRELLNATGR